MKNFTLKLFFSAVLISVSINSFAQERTCGMEQYMEEMLQDPVYAKQYEESQKKFKQRLEEYLSNQDLRASQNTIEIPVAVHFPDANEADRACLEVLAQNQIDILNADYTATNSDIATWNSSVRFLFPGTNAGVADISFCIATSNHPSGLDPELIEGNPAITIGYNFGGGNNRDSNWAGYLNFVVRNINGGILGFSPLGGSVALGDAVTMNLFAFGSNQVPSCPGSGVVPGAPYNLGRTTTHELGHFFNLRHTFNGDGNGSCGSGGDGIADTPEVANSTYNCPSPSGTASCVSGQPALTMNYMDYVNDACMYMFSAGQINVAEAWINSNLVSAFKPNVCQPAAPGFIILANDTELFTCPDTDTEAVFNFSYTAVAGFNENTVFSASGLPSGASVSFSPTSLNSDGNFTMTVGNLDTAAQGNFTITVTGTAPSVSESIDVELTNECTQVICDNTDSDPNLNLPIPDPSGGFAGVVSDVLTISESSIIESMTLSVDVSHTWISDLQIFIFPPTATTFPDDAILLWENECSVSAGSGYDNFSITFDDTGAPFPGTNGCSDNFTGTYAPRQPLSSLSGIDAQGDWEIIVFDFFNGDTGTLNNWSMEICTRQPLSTSEFEINNLSIFPNPNNGEFSIGFDSNSGEDISVEIFDIRGRVIYSQRYNSVSRFEEVINLNKAQSGVYLLNISDGPQKVTKKIIVE
ncbi:T9SS type A sorting domain-containing protein [Winogradskyella sp. DF17]|uniref:T9SS type A sorting domain-containing protein n=1 Tax=Winogradskyella pelagia TaxID=2819984 RepID=A0ABS3SXR9_9FLAO|nr:T9SS type A sorting domain-containing protein [Winogradskyella sp. DF17]MBO3115295.1 T9SS type A sorting domain-containing protein [Winogradskyella sp. DF17]